MLADPFEEEFDLPSVTIQIGCGLRPNGEVVGQKVETLVGFAVVIFDPPQRLGVVLFRLLSEQGNGLVAPCPFGSGL